MTTNNQTFSSYTTYLNMCKVKPQSKHGIKIKEKRNQHRNTIVYPICIGPRMSHILGRENIFNPLSMIHWKEIQRVT